MAIAKVDGLSIAYDVIGDTGRPWIITPGGRWGKDDPGIRELAGGLAERGNTVVVYDRPNCGESDVCFEGPSESVMQADAAAGLLRHLDLGPAVIAGGSGGSRVSLLTAVRHRDLAAGLAVWWVVGGTVGLMSLGYHYCRGSILAAWNGDMEAVAALPEWAEVIERNPSNRDRFLAQDPKEFLATMDRWMLAYCPNPAELVPGLPLDQARSFDLPTLVFRSGSADAHHPRFTSEEVAEVLPNTKLVEPPWGDHEWPDRQAAHAQGEGLFARWPLLVPQLHDWATTTLGS